MTWTPEWYFNSVISEGGFAWSDPDNVLEELGKAVSDPGSGGDTAFLKLYSDIGTIIPEGSTLLGARVVVDGRLEITQSGRFGSLYVNITGTGQTYSVTRTQTLDNTFEYDLAGWSITEQQLWDIVNGTEEVYVWCGDANFDTRYAMNWVRLAIDYESPQTEVLTPPVLF